MTTDLWLIVIAAVPATFGLLLYALAAHWWNTWAGWAFVSTLLAVALLLDLTLFFHWVTLSLPTEENISHGVMVVVAIACWLKFVAIVRQQIIGRRGRR